MKIIYLNENYFNYENYLYVNKKLFISYEKNIPFLFKTKKY